MKKTKSDLSPELLKEYLDYNPINGHLTWIKRPSKKVFVGSRAGTLLKSGYRAVNIFGKSYQEHHLIWFIYYGEWVKEIDHANHTKSDNSIANLSSVTHKENSMNMLKLNDTITGEQGIYYNRQTRTYTATIRKDGKVVYSKSCGPDEIDQLILEREAKLLELGFHINHGK
jgi:hypothetical protein